MTTIINNKLKRMKKFRSQLLAQWINDNYPKQRVGDIGGGKGLLSYLLEKNGFSSTIIDPINQVLPAKYTDLNKKKILIDSNESILRITSKFEVEMAKEYDLLVGLHAHSSNLKIIDAAVKFNIDFILIPCCIIDEGIDPYSVTDWLEYIENYANNKGIKTGRVKLNFKGQRSAIFSDRH